MLKMRVDYWDKCLEGKFNHGAFCNLRNVRARHLAGNDRGGVAARRGQSPPGTRLPGRQSCRDLCPQPCARRARQCWTRHSAQRRAVGLKFGRTGRGRCSCPSWKRSNVTVFEHVNVCVCQWFMCWGWLCVVTPLTWAGTWAPGSPEGLQMHYSQSGTEEINLYTTSCFHIPRYSHLFCVLSDDKCACLGKVAPFKNLSCGDCYKFD